MLWKKSQMYESIPYYYQGNEEKKQFLLRLVEDFEQIRRKPVPIGKKLVEVFEAMGMSIRSMSEYEPSKSIVIWGAVKEAPDGTNTRRINISDQQRENGFKTVLVERGYVQREDYYSFGLTDYATQINNESDFKNEEMPNDRAKDLNVELKPWKEPDKKRKYVLVCGQTYNDANVNDINYEEWLNETLNYLLEKSERRILYRPHPLENRGLFVPEGVKISHERTIEQDFALAATVVSYSSNSCVESVIEGIPSFVISKKSVAWDVANHDLSEINNPKTFDRDQWLNNLAYAQWNLEEIRQGLPFKHLGII